MQESDVDHYSLGLRLCALVVDDTNSDQCGDCNTCVEPLVEVFVALRVCCNG